MSNNCIRKKYIHTEVNRNDLFTVVLILNGQTCIKHGSDITITTHNAVPFIDTINGLDTYQIISCTRPTNEQAF